MGDVTITPDYSNEPTLTENQARQCLPLVQSWLDNVAGPGWTATLHPPGHETRHWNISCEIGDMNWPCMISTQVTWPEGITTKATNHFSLALHPDTIATHTHRAAQHGIELKRTDFHSHGGFITLDGMDAADWIEAMTTD